MNERIVELAKQCASEDHLAIYGSNYAKFAELLIRECAEICLEANDHKNILRHFGLDK